MDDADVLTKVFRPDDDFAVQADYRTTDALAGFLIILKPSVPDEDPIIGGGVQDRKLMLDEDGTTTAPDIRRRFEN